MTLAPAPADEDAALRRLLVLAVPALLIGIVSALVLWALDQVSGVLAGFL